MGIEVVPARRAGIVPTCPMNHYGFGAAGAARLGKSVDPLMNSAEGTRPHRLPPPRHRLLNLSQLANNRVRVVLMQADVSNGPGRAESDGRVFRVAE